MKALAAALLTAATLTCVTSHAADRIDTEGFSLAFGDLREPWMSMSLLSNDDGAVRIALDYVMVAGYTELHTYNSFQYAGFVGSIADGYRVTSMTLRGIWVGVIELTSPVGWETFPGNVDISPGIAFSSSTAALWVQQGGNQTGGYQLKTHSLNGTEGFMTGHWGTLEGEFGVVIGSTATVGARPEQVMLDDPVNGGWYSGQAVAAIRAENIVLTVHVAPVPEPATYGMLMGGLSILGYLARRRKGAITN